MRNHKPKIRPRGIMAAEIVVSVAIMAMMAALAARAVHDYFHARDCDTWYRAVAWAADAQWQRCRAGAPVDSRPPADLVPDRITFQTRVEPGRGPWQGFNHVTVTAGAIASRGKRIEERVSGYMPAEVRP